MKQLSERAIGDSDEGGIGLMEVIVAVLVTVILGAVVLHLFHIGYAMHQLRSTTTDIADKLESARNLAKDRNQEVRLIFDSKRGIFGMDRNANGRLENVEAEELPEGVTISEDLIVTFSRTGSLAPGSKKPQIIISNSRDSRRIRVSSVGAIEID